MNRQGNILRRYTNQTFAKRMKAQNVEFSYNEDFLWNNALFLSSKAILLLNENLDNKVALKALKEAAHIYYNLFEISEKYDKKYCLILSAICFDISGYQANASALIKFLNNNFYELEIEDSYDSLIKHENNVLKVIQLFLEKKLNYIFKYVMPASIKADEIIDEYYKSGFEKFFKGCSYLIRFLLTGTELNYREHIEASFEVFLYRNNIIISHLIDLFLTRCLFIEKRCTWKNINTSENLLWQRYLKLLSLDRYDDNKNKPDKDRISIFEFWISQLEALKKDILNKDQSFVIQMPTGAGKTLIAELNILNALINNPEKKCIYIAPFRALTNEIKDTLSKNIGKLGFVVSSFTGSYELEEDFNNYWLKEANVIVAKPEKIDLLHRVKPEFFDDISIVVVDEGHIIGDESSRAALLEILMVKLKYKLDPTNTKFIFISAVMPTDNLKELSMWLSNSQDNIVQSPK